MEVIIKVIIKELQNELYLQELSAATNSLSTIFSATDSFSTILSATNNLSKENLITEDASGKLYKGQLLHDGNLINFTVRRLDCMYGHGEELQTEISMLKSLKHKNIISVLGHYDENDEKIVIYEQAFHGTLHRHLSNPTLTWFQRLQICLGVADALSYIHYDVIHCDINSSKVILDENWKPKIYGFELSTKYPQSWRHRLLYSRYFGTNNLTPKYDVYSFGVLMFEVLCGRKPMITSYGVEEELDKIIDPILRRQMDKQSLELFTDLAYKCLDRRLMQRPTMDHILKELAEVLELQNRHSNLEHSEAAYEGISSINLKMDLWEIPLSKIRQATKNFDKAYFVGGGAYGVVYKAELDVIDVQGLASTEWKYRDELPKIRKTVAIKSYFHRADEQGRQAFLTEIELLTCCKHPNIVTFVGFSREAYEMILVYEYAHNGSLSDFFRSGNIITLTWAQRIQICLDIAHGISYLHTDMEGKPRIIHRDIKSDNIVLDENLIAKVSDFSLSEFTAMEQQASSIHTQNIAGTKVYIDPEYMKTSKYTRESDIYSFGVVLFEVLSGSLAYDPIYIRENDMGLAPIARRRFNEGTLKELIDPNLTEEENDHCFTVNGGPNQASFDTFSQIAYECLSETQAKRPRIEGVIKELQTALKLQGETVVLSRFRLSDIVLATENFAETYCIGLDTNGTVYKAELDQFSTNSSLATEEKKNGEPSKKHTTVVIKRITNRKGGQGKQEFLEEIDMCTSYKHPNIVTLCGFCDEDDEMILVYDHDSNRSLDDYLKSVDKMDNFTWAHRLHMCLEIARGLSHLHTKLANPQRVIHNDIKSVNILLDEKWGAKIAYSGISKLHKAKQEVDMKVYEDPEYEITHNLETKSDIYSFGVVLFEIFCGRVAYDPLYIVENQNGLAPIACQCSDDGTIERIMDPKLKEETDDNISTANMLIFQQNTGPNQDSLDTFLKIAFQCLGEAAERPTMEVVIEELERALSFLDPSVEFR
uniref:non-specific serine/threonine protein kinase n=1 Tax=Helianthus annuus TaxID=4232 RepID=A0A251SH63_HELAN